MNPSFSWPRPRFVAGGGDALVAFEVCGTFAGQIETVAVEGVDVRVEANDFARFGEVASEMLRLSTPEIAPLVEAAPQVVSIRGVVPDPQNLNYLRDCLSLIETLLENGGIGVIDPQTLQIFSPEQFRFIFCGNAFEPTSHATILLSMQSEKAQSEKAQSEKAQSENAQSEKAQSEKAQSEKAQSENAQSENAQSENIWLRTRGMRLFGRPDLSCHGVKPEEVERLQPVFNGLIRMQAAGAIIADGQIVQAVGIQSRLICRPRGSLDDADFNNFHLELEWEIACELV